MKPTDGLARTHFWADKGRTSARHRLLVNTNVSGLAGGRRTAAAPGSGARYAKAPPVVNGWAMKNPGYNGSLICILKASWPDGPDHAVDISPVRWKSPCSAFRLYIVPAWSMMEVHAKQQLTKRNIVVSGYV